MKKLLFTGLLLLSGTQAFCSIERLLRDFGSYLQKNAEAANDAILDTFYSNNTSAELEIAKKFVDREIGFFSDISTKEYNHRIANMYDAIQKCKYQENLSQNCKNMAVQMNRFSFSNSETTKHSKRTAARILTGSFFIK